MLNKQLVITSILLLGLMSSILAVQASHFFLISKVTCTVDQSQPCQDFVQAELDKNIGQPIFTVNMSEQLKRISSYVPSLHQYQFKQQLPNEMKVNFTSASPKYAIKIASLNDLLIIDETGTVIDQQAQTSLPTIQLQEAQYQGLALRATLDPKVNMAFLHLMDGIKKHQFQVKQIVLVNNSELRLELADQKVAQLTIENVAQEVDKLAYILANVNFSTIKQPVKEIDLRFRYPVLKT